MGLLSGSGITSGRRSIRCRFPGLSDPHSAFSFSCRSSWGDLVGNEARPIGLLGVPSKAFNVLGRSCEGCPSGCRSVAVLVVIAVLASRLCGESTVSLATLLCGFLLFSNSSVKSVSVLPICSPTCTRTGFSSCNSSPS